MPEAEQALSDNMAAYVEGTSREVILTGEDHEDLLKPVGLKPRLTPKPFSLQRNMTIRSILAPKSVKTAPQPVVDAAPPSTTSSTGSAAAPKLNLKKESELSEAGTLTFSSTDKPELTGVLNSSSATHVQKESTPALKPNIPTNDLQITRSTKEKPGSLPEPQKPNLCPACFESSSSPALPDINPKVDLTNRLNQKELGRTQSQAETQANTNMSRVASQEELSKGEEKESATSPALPPMSQDSDVSTSSTDTPVANPTPQWGRRNRLSMKLTSKFESGMLSPATENSQPQEGNKDSRVKEGEVRPGRLVASEPARSPISAPRREEEGGGKIAEKEVGWEETTGGSSIRRRISLLFDPSSRPEVQTRREEPGALCQSNGVGEVKQRIKVWASEAAPTRMLENTPPSIQSLRKPAFYMADSFPEENSLKEGSAKIHDAEDSPEKILGSSTGVSQLLKQFERSEDVPKDVPAVDKPLEMTAEKSVDRDTENSKSSDTLPDLPLKSIIAQPNFDKRPALRRSVRFALEVQEFESPPGSPGLESDVESDDLSGSDDPEAGEDKGSNLKPLHEIGGLLKRQEDHNEMKKTEEKEEKRRAQERQKETLREGKERKLESELETQKQIEEERQKQQEREKLRREVKQKEEERERLGLEREREIEEERETQRRLERQKEEERERLALERKIKIEEDHKKEDERLGQIEVERERKIKEESQKEEERQRLALKRERQREDEKRKEEEGVRQLELKRERIQVEEMRKEDKRKKDRERQEEIEIEREREKNARENEIKKQAEKEERLREDEKKREDQEKIKKQEERLKEKDREQDKRRKEEEEKERQREMEKEREGEKQEKIEKEKLERLKKSLQQDREDEREQVRNIEMEKQREKKLERQREEREGVRQQDVKMLRETDRLIKMEGQKELKLKEEVEKRLKEKQREKQMELENQRKRELEEEMENQGKCELEEKENQRECELEEEMKREQQRKEKGIVKKQEEEMERQRGGGTKELVHQEMEQGLREESKSWTGEERELSETYPVNPMNFTSPQPGPPLTSSDPKSKEDTNSEPPIEVVYDDFSVSRPLVGVIYEDFSVKPRRWGSKAKVPLTNSQMELLSAGVEILKPDAEEPSQRASLDTAPTEEHVDEDVQRSGVTDQEENSDPLEQAELFVRSAGTEREEKIIDIVENQVKEEEEKVIDVAENQVKEEADKQKTMQYLGAKLSAAQEHLTGWVGSVQRSVQGAQELVWASVEDGGEVEEEREEEHTVEGAGGGGVHRAVSPLRNLASRKSLQSFSLRSHQRMSLSRRTTTPSSSEQLTSCTEEGDTEALFGAEADQPYGGCDSTSALESSLSPQPILAQGHLVPPQDTDPDHPLFPETTVPLLDNRAQKSKARLGKRRSVRTRPPRLVNQSSSLTSHTESLAQDWRACDSAEGNMVSPTSGDAQSEKEQPSGKETSQTTPSSHRVALFAGLDPSSLMTQLKKRGRGTDDRGDDKDGVAVVATPAPSQLDPSPRSPFLPGATRVLPPIGSKAGEGTDSSPSWLKELKSKKRLSQHDSGT